MGGGLDAWQLAGDRNSARWRRRQQRRDDRRASGHGIQIDAMKRLLIFTLALLVAPIQEHGQIIVGRPLKTLSSSGFDLTGLGAHWKLNDTGWTDSHGGNT